MKKSTEIYLLILFLAAFGMSSCNPIDEGQLPPSNTSNLTPDQALPLLQGSWYLDRIEYITGPICAGGNNRHVFHRFSILRLENGIYQ